MVRRYTDEPVDPAAVMAPFRLGPEQVSRAATAARLRASFAGRSVDPTDLRAGEPGGPEAALEAHVDLHEFHPHMVRTWARRAGFEPVRVQTEEFLSGLFGWTVRTVEALARPGLLGEKWAWFAYRNYMRLYRLDDLREVPSEMVERHFVRPRKPACVEPEQHVRAPRRYD